MSFQYDQYLARHRANVKRGFDWLSENLPGLMTNTLTAGWNTEFAHDQSKNEPDEYEAYDAYFYGNNRSYEVVQRYQRAWLLHIHRNPHHWQHWVLIHDDMEDGELDRVKQEATNDAINQAMILLLTLPLEVLMDHYWPKSYAKRIPEFTEHVLEYYEKWQNDELDMDKLKEDLWVYGGVRLEEVEGK